MSTGLSSTIAPDNASNFVNSLSALTHAQAGWLDAVGNYQVSQAKAMALDAAAEGDRQVAREKRAAADMLMNQYHRLLVEQHDRDHAVAAISRKARDLRYLWRGEHLDHSLVSVAWAAWNYFYGLIQGVARGSLMKIAVPSECRPAGNYTRGCGYGGRQGVVPNVSDDIENPVQLAVWCQAHNVIPALGHRASLLFEEGLTAMAAAADAMTARLNDQLNELRTATFKTFDPLKVSELPSNTAAQAAGTIGPNPIS